MKPLRFIFMGTPHFAAPSLQAIIDAQHEPVCIYTQPPRPSGRGQKLVQSPIMKLAKHHNIRIETPTSFKDPEVTQTILSKSTDVIIVAAYGQLLPKKVVSRTSIPCINIHASLLPRWRGAAPIQRAIMDGDKTTGITIMRMEEGLDTGPIIAMKELDIDHDDAGKLHDRLAALGARLIVQSLEKLAIGQLIETPQPNEGITYAHRITSSDEAIDWRKSAREILLQIRALSPKPGAFFYKAGDRWKILSADVGTRSSTGIPGEVLDNCLTIACGEDTLRPHTIQRPGKTPMLAKEVLRGTPIPIGTIVS